MPETQQEIPYTQADFRARREALGASQGDFAQMLGVRSLTVKRWESGEKDLPQDVWELLETLEGAANGAVDAAIEGILSADPRPELVELPYFRTQDEYDAFGRDDGPFGIANANSRKIAYELQLEGIECRFKYVGDGRATDAARRFRTQ